MCIRDRKEPEAYLYTEEKEMDIQDDPTENRIDFADVCGQEGARRAAEIAVSGFHNILLIGPPAVSYTHLDVYKRQEKVLSKKRNKQKREIRRGFLICYSKQR